MPDKFCLMCDDKFVNPRYTYSDGTGFCSDTCDLEFHQVDLFDTEVADEDEQ